MEQNIFSLLQSFPPLVALVGKRVYPVELPRDPVYPCLAYKLIGDVQEETLDSPGMQRQRWEFNCYGLEGQNGYGAATSVRRALIGNAASPALNLFSGPLADGTELLLATKINAIDFFDSDARIYRALVEFYLLFNL